MRLVMGLSKDRHGTWYARKKVPPNLREPMARVLNQGKARQTWLKRSLGTKDLKEANRRVKPVQIEFDQLLDQATALLQQQPVRDTLSDIEIKRIAEYHYAQRLQEDEAETRESTGRDERMRWLAKQFDDAGIQYDMPIPPSERTPQFGMSEGEVRRRDADLDFLMPITKQALAKGDISKIGEHLEYLLNGVFGINLNPKSEAFRRLGMAVLRKEVAALEAIERRTKGEPIDSPLLPLVSAVVEPSGETLDAAFGGWKRAGNHSPRTVQDFEYAVRLFGQLHGAMSVAQIRRSHARAFLDALRDVPVRRLRTRKLANASLPELAQWGREHLEAQKIAPTTINKLLGGVQAVGRWARREGLVPEEWADPFADIRIDEDESQRAPFEIDELRAIFSSPVFTGGERPRGQGEAAYWLPLLALFAGARLGELAGLRASDVVDDPLVGAVCIYITADTKVGRRLKTKQSARAIPLHPALRELGFLDFVSEALKVRDNKAWLFPNVAPGTSGAPAFSKWFGRYIGAHGVTDEAKVFHSFRHNFADALRLAGVSEDVRHALLGHSEGGVPGRYGAKNVAERYRQRLAQAINSVAYPGLNLTQMKPPKH